MDDKTRTLSQNSALHLYLEQIAQDLIDSGQGDMKTIVSMPITPTGENMKECVWRVIQRALYPEVESTTKLTTKQIQEVYLRMDQQMNHMFHVSRPWPSIQSQAEEQR